MACGFPLSASACTCAKTYCGVGAGRGASAADAARSGISAAAHTKQKALSPRKDALDRKPKDTPPHAFPKIAAFFTKRRLPNNQFANPYTNLFQHIYNIKHE
jgi:hypothetical protein